jgi:endonuclease-8
VGATIEAVESRGKHLLIRFDHGLELRTHLGMRGSWHRYAPGERWLRSPSRARLVLEVPGAVAVCFDAPTVELYEVRRIVKSASFLWMLPTPARARWSRSASAMVSVARSGSRRRWMASARAVPSKSGASRSGPSAVRTGWSGAGRSVRPRRLDRRRDATAAGPVLAATAPREQRGRSARHHESGTRRAPRRGQGLGVWSGRQALPPLRLDHSRRRHGRLNRRTFWCPSCQAAVAEEPR